MTYSKPKVPNYLFPVSKRVCAKLFIDLRMKMFEMQENEYVDETNFHTNGFARLVLTPRQKTTWKRPKTTDIKYFTITAEIHARSLVNCWRAVARQLTILYNSEIWPKSVGCKIVDLRSRLRFLFPGIPRCL